MSNPINFSGIISLLILILICSASSLEIFYVLKLCPTLQVCGGTIAVAGPHSISEVMSKREQDCGL